jgi:iron(III) transport system ATP-binding protein
VIEIDGLSVRRGAAWVLDGLSLALGPEVAAIVGPSGGGKTTLLRVLLGLDAPTAGTVRINGRVVSRAGRVDVLPEERAVAMLFQDLALWPHLSVHGNLAFGLRARGVVKPERERRIREALSWVGLESQAFRAPHELSGGERQRVAIARALVLEPVAVLLDEPLGSLDVARKDELLGLFGKILRKRSLPVVYVTHDPGEAAQLADRVIVLEGGRVSQQGTLAELRAAPGTSFVEAFVRHARPERHPPAAAPSPLGLADRELAK